MTRTGYSSTISDEPAAARALERRRRLKPADVLVRAATAEVTRQTDGPDRFEDVRDSLRRRYGSCEATRWYLERGVVNPAHSQVATWAAEVATTVEFTTWMRLPASR
jgi:hypothetical protein